MNMPMKNPPHVGRVIQHGIFAGAFHQQSGGCAGRAAGDIVRSDKRQGGTDSGDGIAES
jgi:hypothetical protein